MELDNHTRLISENFEKSSALSQPPYLVVPAVHFPGLYPQVIMYHLRCDIGDVSSSTPFLCTRQQGGLRGQLDVLTKGMNEISREQLKDITSCRFAKRIYILRISFSKRNANLMMCQFLLF